jgi:hypothetical protein
VRALTLSKQRATTENRPWLLRSDIPGQVAMRLWKTHLWSMVTFVFAKNPSIESTQRSLSQCQPNA